MENIKLKKALLVVLFFVIMMSVLVSVVLGLLGLLSLVLDKPINSMPTLLVDLVALGGLIGSMAISLILWVRLVLKQQWLEKDDVKRMLGDSLHNLIFKK